MSKRPALTIVVCQRQSNYRMVPKEVNPQGRAPDQNCQPGTVLDKGVGHGGVGVISRGRGDQLLSKWVDQREYWE